MIYFDRPKKKKKTYSGRNLTSQVPFLGRHLFSVGINLSQGISIVTISLFTPLAHTVKIFKPEQKFMK